MIEAEVKAKVHDPKGVLDALEQRAEARSEVYADTYFDQDGRLDATDRELRIRTVHGATSTRSVLTYKEPRVDAVSGSKPEWETVVADPAALHTILGHLGYSPALAFEKRCRSYDLAIDGRSFAVTFVQVPELGGHFFEVETSADTEQELPGALDAVRTLLRELGIGAEDETNELYTDAVAARRRTG
ncbi:class IV adenylate cyclase [Streptacidiphilus rugosus]|uniref:class IV adenylate cyclase n=1 Tax=Streptacidiphilus rugosus TaxID=405783 RepID=UPI000563C0A6|nr:class IV adenylate cyclase [Streptacidiphilus rugosus]